MYAGGVKGKSSVFVQQVWGKIGIWNNHSEATANSIQTYNTQSFAHTHTTHRLEGDSNANEDIR